MEKPLGWQIYCLEMDKAGKRIGTFFSRNGYDIRRINPLKGRRGYRSKTGSFFGTDISLEKAMKTSIRTDSRVLALYGKGSLHHITYGLCRLADRLSSEYCYIHIDHHQDFSDEWYICQNHEKEGDCLGCGDFVKHIMFQSNVGKKPENVIFIGNDRSNDMQPDDISDMGRQQERKNGVTESSIRRSGFGKLESLLDNSAKDAYVTMDLDVMHPSELITGYDRGTLRKRELLDILALIKSKKRIISADILGYDTRAGRRDGAYLWYIGKSKPASEEKTLGLYRDIADFILKA